MEILIDDDIKDEGTLAFLINWAARKLKIENHQATIFVRKVKMSHAKGECWQLHSKCFMISITPAMLKLAKQCSLEGLNTLFHEVTHVKQFLKKEFDILDNGRILWKGKKMRVSYWESPAEIEAHGRGETLARLFLEEMSQ